MDPKWTQNGPKMDPRWTQDGPTHTHLELDTHPSEDHPPLQHIVVLFSIFFWRPREPEFECQAERMECVRTIQWVESPWAATECREFIIRVECCVAKMARLRRLEQQSQGPPPVHPPSRVADVEQQITAFAQERRCRIFFFRGSRHKLTKSKSQLKPRLEKPRAHPASRPACLKSRSTSWACRQVPSARREPGRSNKDMATAHATAHESREPQWRRHACSTRFLIRSLSERALLSVDHRPPTSTPNTTSLAQPPLTVSSG